MKQAIKTTILFVSLFFCGASYAQGHLNAKRAPQNLQKHPMAGIQNPAPKGLTSPMIYATEWGDDDPGIYKTTLGNATDVTKLTDVGNADYQAMQWVGMNDNIYVVTYQEVDEGAGVVPKNTFGTIDPVTGDLTVIAEVDWDGISLAWHSGTSTMYATTWYGQFGTVNLTTGAFTTITTWTTGPAFITIDNSGVCFIQEYDFPGGNRFGTLNLATGAITTIATRQYVRYLQNLTVDYETDELYWAGTMTDGQEGIYFLARIDKATGMFLSDDDFVPINHRIQSLCIIGEINAAAPSAPTNVALVRNGVTAELSWTAPTTSLNGDPLSGEGLLYDVFRMPENIRVATDQATTTFSEIITAQGIFSYRVAAKNAAGTGGSATSNAETFCPAIMTDHWVEGFNNVLQFPPHCWTTWRSPGTSENGEWGLSEMAPRWDGAYAIRRMVMGSNQESWLITPPITLDENETYRLKFMSFTNDESYYVGGLNATIGNGLSKVFISTKSNNRTDFTELLHTLEYGVDVLSPPAWSEVVLDLGKFKGETIYIGFQYTGNFAHAWHLDDVQVYSVFDDIAVLDITTPKNGININLSDNQDVTVRLKSFGEGSATGFTLTLLLDDVVQATETYTGSIASLAEANYTFTKKLNLLADATYRIQVIANLISDQNPTNDTATITVINTVCPVVTTFPFVEYFNEALFPPRCWTIWNSPETPSNGLWKRGMQLEFGDEGPAWDGSYAVRMDALGDNQESWLIMPAIDLAAGGEHLLKFMSYTGYTFGYTGHPLDAGDGLSKVFVSKAGNDPGNPANFTEVYTLQFGTDVPQSPAWREIDVDLSAFAGETVYIGFQYTGSFAHIWRIDDVKVYDQGDFVDAELVTIITPNTSTNLTEEEVVKVLIKNGGVDALSGFHVKLEVNGIEVADELFDGSIAGLDRATYTFTHKLDLSEANTYTLKATVVVAGDMYPANDSETKIVINKGCPYITDYPWRGDLGNFAVGQHNAFSECWVNFDADGDGVGWVPGVLGTSGIQVAISESYNFGHLYPDNWFITPKLVIDHNRYELSFEIGSFRVFPEDKFSVFISETGTNPEDFTEVYSEVLNNNVHTVIRGDFGFKTVRLPLFDYGGKTIHIAFRHWDCVNLLTQQMILLSDIMVDDISGFVDGEVVEIVSPANAVNMTANEAVTVKLKNNGGADITGFTLKIEVDGVLKVTETYNSTPIPSWSEMDYTFTQTVDLSGENQGYWLTVTMELADDEVAENNFTIKNVANFPSGSVDLYGYIIYDDSWATQGRDTGFVKFSTANPEVVTMHHRYPLINGANRIYAGEFADSALYFYTVHVAPLEMETKDFIKANATDFSTITRAAFPYNILPADMAYDHSTNTMYAIVTSPNFPAIESALVTVNLDTGVMTWVGSMYRMMTIACNLDGEIYTVDRDGDLHFVDKETGATTLIGNTGVTPLYIQSMAFDHNTGRLFWAMRDYDHGRLLEINTQVGAARDLGQLGGNAELTSLYSLYPAAPPTNTRPLTEWHTSPLQAWMQDGELHVSGLTIGQLWSIYNLSGQVVYQAIADTDPAVVTLPGRGVYIIRSGNKIAKVVKQ
ncbi:MAG: choice-of-anchor J domain-containing protein [Bacteroidales bacterium]|nr:choice-of-anchor J domain-containing protein [Bacteroidales bacterium]